MYLFGHLQGFYPQRRIYDYIRRHWRAWFPDLPSYQAFNRRLNELAAAFEQLIATRLEATVTELAPAAADRLIDSLPVILAHSRRSDRARVAPEVADKGYCATKQSYYYGVKLRAARAAAVRSDCHCLQSCT